MASIECQKGRYRIVLRYAGQKHQRALDTQDEREALALKSRVEENLKLLRRGENVSHVTIKKELGTLSSVWNKWGMGRGVVSRPLSLKNLEYPKRKEKQTFQTWEQIERRVRQGASDELWDSVFLTVGQIEE